MIDGLIAKIERELGTPAASVVATGGVAGKIIPECERGIETDPHLLLYGLKAIFDRNRK